MSDKFTEEWLKRQQEAGLTGNVRVLTEGSDIPQSDETRHIDPETKTIESKTLIPPEMLPHMKAIFRERDRLWLEWSNKPWEPGNWLFDKFAKHSVINPELPRGAVVNELLLPVAIENVRKSLEGKSHDE